MQEFFVHTHHLDPFAHEFQQLDGVELFLALSFTDCVDGALQKSRRAHSGDLYRVLEREENTGLRPFIHFHFQQVLPFEGDGTFGHFILLAPGQYIGQRALARSVRPHNGMHFTGFDLKVKTLQNEFVINTHLQIFDRKRRTHIVLLHS